MNAVYSVVGNLSSIKYYSDLPEFFQDFFGFFSGVFRIFFGIL